MKITITGENGYIAKNLYAYLSENGEEPVCVSFRQGADGVGLDGSDAVVHLAAIVHKREKDFRELYDRVNHVEAVKLALRAKQAGVRHFVFMSTMSVYGLKSGRIDQNTPCDPRTLYGISKLAAEEEILSLADEHFGVCIVRPPMVYGRDCPGNFASLKRFALKTPVFPKTENKRSMIYIENLTYALYNILRNGIYGIVMPSDAEYVSTSDMVCKIAASRGKMVRLVPFVGRLAAMLPGPFKKVFASLYYDKDIAMGCGRVSFEEAVKRSV